MRSGLGTSATNCLRSVRPPVSAALPLVGAFAVAVLVALVLPSIGAPGGGVVGLGSSSGAVTATQSPSAEQWPTYLGNTFRTSNSTTETWLTRSDASELEVNWSFATADPVASSASEVGGVTYFGSWDGYEYAVSDSTGQLLWKTYLGVDSDDSTCGAFALGVSSAPTIANGVVYLGGNNATGGVDAAWYALDAATGAIEWSIPVGSMAVGFYNWASPLIYDGFAYVGLASKCANPLVPAGLLQVNLATHKVQNFFHTTPKDSATGDYELGSSIWTTPSVDPRTNTVFATTGNPESPSAGEPYSEAIVAFNASNISRNQAGQPGLEAYWHIPGAQRVADGDFGAGPTLLRGAGPDGTDIVVAGDKNGREYAWNATDLSSWTVSPGQLGTLWQIRTGTTQIALVSPASYGGGLLYFTTPAITIAGKAFGGSLWAVRPATGQVVWKDPLAGQGIGAPLYAGGVLVVGAGDALSVFNSGSGALIHRWTYSAGFVDAVALADGRLYVGNYDGDEYALCIPSATCTASAQP